MAPMASRGYRLNSHEKKVFDIAGTSAKANTANLAANTRLLCIPILGTDINSRIGRKILLKSVYIRGWIAGTQATNTTAGQAISQLVRLMIVFDTQPNGAAIVPGDVLDVGTTPVSHLNINNRDRFQILCDKQYTIDPYDLGLTASSTYASTSGQTRPFKFYKKLNKEMIFNSTNGGGIADITTGALWFIFVGSNPSGATDSTVYYTSRVRYLDM